MKIFKSAFTLAELMVVIVILSILGAISLISLQSYSSDARDGKRKSDINNIYTKINVELSKGKTLDQLIVVTNTGNIIINNNNLAIRNQGITNFSVLKENMLDFQDKGINYPISYSIGNAGALKSNFVQIATFSESNNQAIVIGNYYKLHILDSDGIIVNSENKVVLDGGSILPY